MKVLARIWFKECGEREEKINLPLTQFQENVSDGSRKRRRRGDRLSALPQLL